MPTERSLHVDVYHSGAKMPASPFLIVPANTGALPDHPDGKRATWAFWKQCALWTVAVDVARARAAIAEQGFYLQ